jgi:hypothetical protein
MFLRCFFGRTVPVLCAAALLVSAGCATSPTPAGDRAVARRIAAAEMHPRLLMTAAEGEAVRERIARDATAAAVFAAVRADADALLDTPPVVYKKDGKRLLSVSREALARVLCLAFVHRMTDDPKYAARALAEMEATAGFSDWNPSHFLDTAEMAAALAIGYDWLYPLLSPEQEGMIRRAILDKGIHPSFEEKRGWITGNNNWNQVCHGGMVFGALALLEREPELAERVITRALRGVPHAMDVVAPDGVYPEGPSYWEYGTTYNVLLIAALESALGSDFGLMKRPGFRETGAYPLLMTGPTGGVFGFSDSSQTGALSPAVFWFAREYRDPGLAWFDHQRLQAMLAEEQDGRRSRFLPLLLLWWDGKPAAKPRQPLGWKGEGINPVAVFRTSWTDPGAAFLAVKAGTPSANHGHMDAGSFIYEADGVRWALEFGSENYGKLEARGMGIWDRKQGSDRWSIFRYHNISHNTLTVDGAEQVVTARAGFTRFSARRARAVMDLSTVYGGQLARAERGFALLPDGRVLIQDEITAGDAPARVRWAMATPADIAETAPGQALLVKDGKQLRLEVLSRPDAAIETFTTDPPPNEWDTPNPGTRQVGFHTDLAPGESITLTVLLTPGSAGGGDAPVLEPLSKWPGKAAGTLSIHP